MGDPHTPPLRKEPSFRTVLLLGGWSQVVFMPKDFLQAQFLLGGWDALVPDIPGLPGFSIQLQKCRPADCGLEVAVVGGIGTYSGAQLLGAKGRYPLCGAGELEHGVSAICMAGLGLPLGQHCGVSVQLSLAVGFFLLCPLGSDVQPPGEGMPEVCDGARSFGLGAQ